MRKKDFRFFCVRTTTLVSLGAMPTMSSALAKTLKSPSKERMNMAFLMF